MKIIVILYKIKIFYFQLFYCIVIYGNDVRLPRPTPRLDKQAHSPGCKNFGALYFFQAQHTKYRLSGDWKTKLHKKRFVVVVCMPLRVKNCIRGRGAGSIPLG
jgi:hypothetical protein